MGHTIGDHDNLIEGDIEFFGKVRSKAIQMHISNHI